MVIEGSIKKENRELLPLLPPLASYGRTANLRPATNPSWLRSAIGDSPAATELGRRSTRAGRSDKIDQNSARCPLGHRRPGSLIS
jgi:hypothetical protein